MKKLIFSVMAFAMLTACSGKSDAVATANDSVSTTSPSLIGDWVLTAVAVDDSLVINPADVESEEVQTITFVNDSLVSFKTNCNIINGTYTVSGDSLKFDQLLCTRMMCPDMRVEDNLNLVLPQVMTYTFVNDSTVRFNTDIPSRYIQAGKVKK